MIVKLAAVVTFLGLASPAFALELLARPVERLPLYHYSTVISHLSTDLEDLFNVIIFVNTSENQDQNMPVPSQHMLVVQRTRRFVKGKSTVVPMFDRSGGQVDLRRSGGTILGIANARILKPDNSEKNVSSLYSNLFPVSTGQGGKYLLTFSGIFGFNPRYNLPTDDPDYKWVYPGYGTGVFQRDTGMAFSSFLEYKYTDDSPTDWAKVAIHATPTDKYSMLGKNRASEGCIRTSYRNAQIIQQLLMAKGYNITGDPEDSLAMWGMVPMLDDHSQFGAFLLDYQGNKNLHMRQKALIVLFDGY